MNLRPPASYATNQDYYAHIYALVLLGHFKEQRAHQAIVEVFSLAPDIPYQLFGDLVTETLTIILFRTCGGSTDMIRSLILNRDADDYCRGSAMRAMVFAVAEGMIPREEVLALFGSLFTGYEAVPDSFAQSPQIPAKTARTAHFRTGKSDLKIRPIWHEFGRQKGGERRGQLGLKP